MITNKDKEDDLKSLKISAKLYKKIFSYEFLKEKFISSPHDKSLLKISDVAEIIGFRTSIIECDKISFFKINSFPSIISYEGEFTVLKKIKKKESIIIDSLGKEKKINNLDFFNSFFKDENSQILLLQPTPKLNSDNNKKKKSLFSFLEYITPYKKYFTQLGYGLLVISLLQFISPFLTQMLIDKGVNGRDISLVNLILISLIVLQIGKAIAQFIKSWIYLHVGTRINVAIVSDFLTKIMKLPISFFDSRAIGDILQRIGDHKRIERFLTNSLLNIIFSTLNLIVFSSILLYYNKKIFLFFFIGSILYVAWTLFFWNIRKKMDYNLFTKRSKNQNILVQLIQSVQEIKLQNLEKEKRWDWEKNQIGLFKEQSKLLIINQIQSIGALLLNETKNTVIIYLAAIAVIEGEITFGMMVAIQYIMGQANAPVQSYVSFIKESQMAQISFDRLNEIHDRNNESDRANEVIVAFPKKKDLTLNNVNFNYKWVKRKFSLTNINFKIPEGKVTAIVGPSGSGKTTLIKLLLRFYYPESGKIDIGGMDIKNLDIRWWRKKCGVILQDSLIFEDTILKNIIGNNPDISIERLIYSAKVANIYDFVESQPQGFNAKLNYGGKGLSQGQKQRILIARTVYKNPDYIFFDEATNSLDSKNEAVIMKNLKQFFKNKTVVVIAHRLSTIADADNIIVMDNGKIIEEGNHEDLIKEKGMYSKLAGIQSFN